MSKIDTSEQNYTIGSIVENKGFLAELNVTNVASMRPESTRMWKTTLKANNQRVYNVIVTLYSRGYWGMGVRLSTVPVWQLEVNGSTVTKDTKGYGHWAWNKGLTVNGVKLKITTCSPHPVPIEAEVCLEDVSLW